MYRSTLAIVAALFASNMAFAQSIADRNGMMTDGSGKTLYTFDKDSPGKSTCTGGCSSVWPPFAAKEGAKDNGKFTLITREDGVKQWALDGKALYVYSLDAQPGDAKGDGVGGVWHAVKSAGAKSAAPATGADGYNSYKY